MEKSFKIEGGISLNVNGDFSAAYLTINGEEKYFCADTPQELIEKLGNYLLTN